MALGVFVFSREGRVRIAVVLRAMLIAQLVVSLLMVIFCYNASIRVMVLLKDIHKLRVFLVYALILGQAYSMKLHYTSGLRLITWLLKFPSWPRAYSLCMLWQTTGTLMVLNGLLVYAACYGSLKILIKEMSVSLRIGISQYLTEPYWKKLMDTMQVELDCCGIEKPTDWHEIPWINMNVLNEDSDLVLKLANTDGRVLPPVSPFSCCTPRVLAACYHDPLQQEEWRDLWAQDSPLLSAALHQRGCVDAIRAPLGRTLLALKYCNVLVFILQVFITALSQLLRTSSRDAALAGDSGGRGAGQLMGKAPLIPNFVESEGDAESNSLLLMEGRRRFRQGRKTSYAYLS